LSRSTKNTQTKAAADETQRNTMKATATAQLLILLLGFISSVVAFSSRPAPLIKRKPTTAEEDFELTRKVVKFQEDIEMTRDVIAEFIRKELEMGSSETDMLSFESS
jgi:hypothetical protein